MNRCHRRAASLAATALLTAACASAPATGRTATPAAAPAPAVASTAWGVVTDGGVALVDARGATLFAASPAVATPDGRTVVATVVATATDGARTSVQWLDGATGTVEDMVEVPGRFRPAVVAADGDRVALVGVDDRGAPPRDPRYLAPGRSTTTLAVVTRNGTTQRDTLAGNAVPEAFTQFGALALVEYLPPLAPDRYRVRLYRLETGAVDLPVSWTDKGASVDEEMQGYSRTHVPAPDGTALFTLYAQPGGDGAGHAFIHVLGLDLGRVYCLDLPIEAGFGQHPGALAAAPDSGTLYALSGSGRLVEMATRIANVADPTPPTVVRTIDLGQAGDDPGPTVTVDDTTVYAAVGATLVTVDRRTGLVTSRRHLDTTVTAMRATPGELQLAGGGWLLQRRAGDDRLERTPLALSPDLGAVRALYRVG